MSELCVMPLLQRRTWMASILSILVNCVWTRDPWCLPHLQLSGRSSKEQVNHKNLFSSITHDRIYLLAQFLTLLLCPGFHGVFVLFCFVSGFFFNPAGGIEENSRSIQLNFLKVVFNGTFYFMALYVLYLMVLLITFFINLKSASS